VASTQLIGGLTTLKIINSDGAPEAAGEVSRPQALRWGPAGQGHARSGPARPP